MRITPPIGPLSVLKTLMLKQNKGKKVVATPEQEGDGRPVGEKDDEVMLEEGGVEICEGEDARNL